MRLVDLFGGRHLPTTLVLAGASAAAGVLTVSAVLGGPVATVTTTHHATATKPHGHARHGSSPAPQGAVAVVQEHPETQSPSASASPTASASRSAQTLARPPAKPTAAKSSAPAASPSAPSSSPSASPPPSSTSSPDPSAGAGAPTAPPG